MQHKMKIVEIRILEVEFHINKDFKGEDKAILFAPNIALLHNFKKETNDLTVYVGLKQKAGAGDVPYFFEIMGGGIFKFDSPPDDKTLEVFSNINCPAIIFPYIRETIADLSRRAGFPALHLNPINFIELDKERKKGLEEKKSTPNKSYTENPQKS